MDRHSQGGQILTIDRPVERQVHAGIESRLRNPPPTLGQYPVASAENLHHQCRRFPAAREIALDPYGVDHPTPPNPMRFTQSGGERVTGNTRSVNGSHPGLTCRPPVGPGHRLLNTEHTHRKQTGGTHRQPTTHHRTHSHHP